MFHGNGYCTDKKAHCASHFLRKLYSSERISSTKSNWMNARIGYWSDSQASGQNTWCFIVLSLNGIRQFSMAFGII